MNEQTEAVRLADPELAQYGEELDAIRLDARTLLEELSDEQANWRPSAARWSVGQCVDHLTMTLRLYPPLITAAVAEARERSARRRKPYAEGFFTRWFVRSMEPPPRMRVRTFRKVTPTADRRAETVAAEFEAACAEFERLLHAADGVPLRQGRVPSPFVPLLKFTLGQAFALNLAHARRHLWQARQVRQEPGFPAS